VTASDTIVKPLFRHLPDDCCMSYKNLFAATKGQAKNAREECEALWRKFHDLADSNFADRFPYEFHQRWFEMYLGATLRDANLEVSAPKPGPDFCVSVGGGPIYIEAIVPEAGNPLHADHVPESDYRDADGNIRMVQVPHTPITLRLAVAFQKKAGAYNRYRLKGTIPRDAVCIIAINLRDIPHAWADDQEFWVRALYGVGDRYVAFNRDGSAAVEGRHHRELLHGAEADGPATEVASLLNINQADVSGVIGSSGGAGNVRMPLGDDFALMPHAMAKFPYPASFIGRGIELKLTPSEDASRWDVETVDYGAVEPQGPNTTRVQYNGEAHEAVWEVSGRELSVRVGGRGITQPINCATDAAALAEYVAKVMLGYYDAKARDD
jgi:hypothetical protein